MKFKSWTGMMLAVLAWAGTAVAGPQVAGELLVNLDSAGLKAGALTEWANAGGLKGAFKAAKQAPRVVEVKGRPVVVFTGAEHLVSDFQAPETLTGDAAWSLEVWAFKHEFGQNESTMVSWAPRGLGDGRTAQFSWGDSALAAIHWGRDLAWRPRPAAGAWQYLVFVHGGGQQKLYVNGRLNQEAPRVLDIARGHPVVIGAATIGRGTESPFMGALAAVRIHGGALTDAQVLANYELERGKLAPLPPTAPAVTADRPAGIRADSAYLNGRVVATGGAKTRVWVYWGPKDGGTDPAQWAKSRELGEQAIGELAVKVDGLPASSAQAYRFRAVNEVGESWSAAAATFTTRPPAAAAGDPARRPFRVVVWPDSQNASDQWPELLVPMAKWIADNKDALNIQYVIHVGDMVQTGAKREEWERFEKAMQVLDGRVPYILAFGNHDTDRKPPRGTGLFNEFFPVSRFQKMPGFGGSFPEGSNDNSYHTFKAAGRDWLIVSLMYNPNTADLVWANEVITKHPRHTVIIATHSYLMHTGRDRAGERMWNELVKKHANIITVFCGHLTTVNFKDKGEHGNTVYEMLFDWQNSARPEPNSYLALVEFDPAGGRISVESYSPVLDRFYTDARANFGFENVQFPAVK